MAVDIRGYVQLSWESPTPPVWPAGCQPGDVAIVWNTWPDGGPYTTGWRFVKWDTWWKPLTAAEIAAGPGMFRGRLLGILVVSGCRGLFGTSDRRGVTVREAGGAALIEAWSEEWSGASDIGWADYRIGTAIRARKNQWHAWWLKPATVKGWTEISRDGDIEGYRGIELLPTIGPGAPVVTAPEGEQDVTAPIRVTWAGVVSQEACKIRLKPASSSTWQYLTSSGTLSSTEQVLAGSAASALIAAGACSTQDWDLAVAVMELSLWSPWSTQARFTPATPPTVSPTLSTTHGRMSVDVVWVPTTPGGEQIAWQVAVAPAGAAPDASLWRSPVTASTATHVTSDVLSTWDNGSQYEAWLRVQQTGGLWSAWTASAAQVVSWTPPTAPASIDVADGSPLTITVDGIVSTATVLEVQSSPDGVEWSTMRRMDLPNAAETILNPRAEYAALTYYRARVFAAVEGVDMPSLWIVAAQPVASTDTDAYLVDGDDWLRVFVAASGPRTVVQGISVTYGESSGPRVDRTTAAGHAGTTTVRVDDALSRAILIDWLTTRDSWWLRWPPEIGRADYPARHAEPPTRMALAGQVQIARWAAFYQSREITWSWVETEE